MIKRRHACKILIVDADHDKYHKFDNDDHSNDFMIKRIKTFHSWRVLPQRQLFQLFSKLSALSSPQWSAPKNKIVNHQNGDNWKPHNPVLVLVLDSLLNTKSKRIGLKLYNSLSRALSLLVILSSMKNC